MWSNYTVVSLDVGELHEVVRAMTRVIEERAEKDGPSCVDVDVLDKLVAAVTRETSAAAAVTPSNNSTLSSIPEDGEGQAVGAAARTGALEARVNNLFEQTILPRVSTPRIFKAYAQLKTAEGAWADALKAHMDAYRAAPTQQGPWENVAAWREALREVEEIVDVLRNFGPRAEGGDGTKWRVQARGLVRTFAGRSKDFSDEPEWARLQALQDELKKQSD